jgi:hypothetical protein
VSDDQDGVFSETAVWNHLHRREEYDSVEILKKTKPGMVLRINHPDVNCHSDFAGNRTCGLKAELTRLRKQGWEIESYHEADHIIVVRRTK